MPFDGWQAQGYPTFCGTGEYRIDVEIPDGAVSPDGWELLLPATEDSAEVLVNGRPAGAAPGRPTRFGSTGRCMPGSMR